MNKFPAVVCGILLICALGAASASETLETISGDSLRGNRVVLGQARPIRSRTVGYYPTLRYYGKDYTVRYGFVPVSVQVLRRITEPNPLLISPSHPVRSTDSTRMVVGHRASTGPVFRATTKTISVSSESAPGSTPAAAAPVDSTTVTTTTTTVGKAPLQPALPAPAETSVQPPAEK